MRRRPGPGCRSPSGAAGAPARSSRAFRARPDRPMPVALALLLLALGTPACAAGAPVHHVLELHPDPPPHTLPGVAWGTLAPHAPLAFTLSPGFLLVRVRADTHEIRPTDTGGRHALALDAATAHDVVIEYHATLGGASAAAELTGPVASPAGSCLPGPGWF